MAMGDETDSGKSSDGVLNATETKKTEGETTDAAKATDKDKDEVGYGTNNPWFGTAPCASSSTFGSGSTAFTNTLSGTGFGGFDGSNLVTNLRQSFGTTKASKGPDGDKGSDGDKPPTTNTTNGSGTNDTSIADFCKNLIETQQKLKPQTELNIEMIAEVICNTLCITSSQDDHELNNAKQQMINLLNQISSLKRSSQDENSHNPKRFKNQNSELENTSKLNNSCHKKQDFSNHRNNPPIDVRLLINGKSSSNMVTELIASDSSNIPPSHLGNSLTMVVTDAKYPETLLTEQQFELFREALRQHIDKTPVNEWPKFEISYFRSGVFIIIASEPTANNWLHSKLNSIKPWKDAALVVKSMQMIEKTVIIRTWIPSEGATFESSEVLKRLQNYNPTLKTSSWTVTNEDTTDGMAILDIQIPESELKILATLNDKPYYDLGRILTRVIDQDKEKHTMECS